MNITDKNIDGGKAFDWGKTSTDYAKFRDIYPQEFYDKIIDRGLCMKGQSVLDAGTGTGVLPRNMYRYGARWTGTDISVNQVEQAGILPNGQVKSKFFRMLKPDGRILILYMAWCGISNVNKIST